jgi:tetratricopeptide (TPR) repeat protein
MVDAVGFGVGEWVVAGLHRVGLAYAEMAGFLAQAPLPDGLSEAEAREYRSAVEARVENLEARADELFGTCVTRALELGVLTPATRGCLAQGPAEPVPSARPPATASAGQAGLEELQASLTRRPEDLDAIRALVEHLLAEGQPARAKIMAAQALEEDDRDPRLHAYIGAAELALGDASAAYAAFERAAELGHPYAALNQAALLASIGAEDAARRLLDASPVDRVPEVAVDLHPDAPALFARLR